MRERIPTWLEKTTILICAYVVAMLALTHWLSVWHDWDWQFYEWLKPSPATISPDIALVDFQYEDRADIPQHRITLAKFITSAAKQHPRAIVLDIPFGQCTPLPCSREMEASRQLLVQAIRGATSAGDTPAVRVFANVGDIHLADGLPNGSAPLLDPQIYKALSGYGHTAAVVLTTRERTSADHSGDLFYSACFPGYPSLFQGQSPQDVWALVDVALYWPAVPPRLSATNRKLCNSGDRIPVRYGPVIGSLHLPTEYSISQVNPFPKAADFTGKFVIVGVPTFDTDRSMTAHPGSDLLAWIFNDELTYDQFDPNFATSALQVQGGALRFLVPAFSALTALAFAAAFLALRRIRQGAARRFLRWVAAAVAFGIGILIFAAFEIWMAQALHKLQPQVALISLGMAVAAGLCGVRGRQIEFAAICAIEPPSDPEHYDYDVLISYAHDERDWVTEHIFTPLSNAKLSDGRTLKIFFDTSSIKIGNAWQDQISLAIDGSKFIIAVYSDIYFRRPYCGFEIRRAHRKWINAGPDSRCVFPIMRGHPQILETVDDIQAVSISDQPDVTTRVIGEIVSRLSFATTRPS